MTNITTLRPGEHFMFKGFEWVCLDPHHPDGGVLAIMAEPWAKDVKFSPMINLPMRKATGITTAPVMYV